MLEFGRQIDYMQDFGSNLGPNESLADNKLVQAAIDAGVRYHVFESLDRTVFPEDYNNSIIRFPGSRERKVIPIHEKGIEIYEAEYSRALMSAVMFSPNAYDYVINGIQEVLSHDGQNLLPLDNAV